MSEALGKDTDAGLFDVPTEYVKVDNPIKAIERRTFQPINATNGDAIQFTYDNGRDIQFQRTLHIKRPMAVDTAIVIEIKDAFGLDVGCGLLIGESKK